MRRTTGVAKDRPVLVVAREPAGTVLAVQLSSQAHDDDVGWVPIGAGAGYGQGRPSWANLSRLLRVHEQGMRREAASLDHDRFDRVVARPPAEVRLGLRSAVPLPPVRRPRPAHSQRFGTPGCCEEAT
jgi:hypothetical protein